MSGPEIIQETEWLWSVSHSWWAALALLCLPACVQLLCRGRFTESIFLSNLRLNDLSTVKQQYALHSRICYYGLKRMHGRRSNVRIGRNTKVIFVCLLCLYAHATINHSIQIVLHRELFIALVYLSYTANRGKNVKSENTFCSVLNNSGYLKSFRNGRLSCLPPQETAQLKRINLIGYCRAGECFKINLNVVQHTWYS